MMMMMMRLRGDHRKLIYLLFLIVTFIHSGTAVTVLVAPTGGQGHDVLNCGEASLPCATLQYAVSNRTSAGDTVVAMPGVHRGPFGPAGELGTGIQLFAQNITVTGRGRAIVDCQGSGRGFWIKDSGRHELSNPNL